MKNFNVLFLLFVTNLLLGQTQNDNFYKKNKDILSLNAIVADKTYYSQAILEYQLVKRIIAKHSSDSIVNDSTSYLKLFYDIGFGAAEVLGVEPCTFKKPISLVDLKSGFQFRHYLFRSNNSTAIRAFGIIDNEIQKNDLFVVIDFIQYQDINCPRIPKIRYGVGMRAEFKISGVDLNKSNDKELNNINVENLAANVQFGRLKVDISIKTIGITGAEARFSIPSNTTFDVQTYGEYKSIINFIRNIQQDKKRNILIQPEIIPVMDEYRTSISEINTAIFDEMIAIKKKYKKFQKSMSSDDDAISKYIKTKIDAALTEEVTLIHNKEKELKQIDKYLNNLEKFSMILENISLDVQTLDDSSSTSGLIAKNENIYFDLEIAYQQVFKNLSSYIHKKQLYLQ